MTLKASQTIKVLLLYLMLAFFARALTILPAVIDHDESTYILIADQLLDGRIPYVDNLDIKPVGIYLIYAAGLKLLGNSIAGIRILTILVIAFSAFFLFLAKKGSRGDPIPLFTGIAYVLMMSLHKWTWSGNTEIYFNFFTCIGIWILMKGRRDLHFFLLGLAMGMGFMIKYLVSMDMAGFGLFYLMREGMKANWSKAIRRSVLMAAGFVVPFAVTALTYRYMGYLDEFVYVSFELPGAYAVNHSALSKLSLFAEYLLVYLPFILMWIFSIFTILKEKKDDVAYRFLAIGWFLLAWIAIFLPGKEHHHYLFQAIPPTVFFMFDFMRSDIRWSRAIKPLYIYIVFAGVLITSISMQYKEFFTKSDHAAVIAEFLNERLNDKDRIFVLDQNIIYFLTDKDVPTKYIHPTLLVDEEHVQSLQLDQEKEFQRIFSLHPRFVIVHEDYLEMGGDEFMPFIEPNYKPIATWDEGKIKGWEILTNSE